MLMYVWYLFCCNKNLWLWLWLCSVSKMVRNWFAGTTIIWSLVSTSVFSVPESLNYWGRVTLSKLDRQYWLRSWLICIRMPFHILNLLLFRLFVLNVKIQIKTRTFPFKNMYCASTLAAVIILEQGSVVLPWSPCCVNGSREAHIRPTTLIQVHVTINIGKFGETYDAILFRNPI